MMQVLSIKLDEWTDEQVDTFIGLGGNNEANLKYEACIPDNVRKPRPDSSIEDRSDFIRYTINTLHGCLMGTYTMLNQKPTS